ncbi:hypothetical protein [Fibrobacter sp. UWEL]|uniref:hypothetical protein n=1 Tax=Fibrobacter sp. UWEL TaxID=1896209 RepID=UPI00091C794C|nr:hypothetical protein [Fibrobacter sp. UWEL]SHK34834.1 hypothetical protein SAMN05720468_101179 [Fibrobacter sp. UWEL]
MRLLLFILAFSVSAFAGYFLEEDIPAQKNTREISPLRLGVGADLGFYLNSPDLGLDLSGEYRIHKNHSLDLFAGTLFGGEMYEVGLNWRFFFITGLEESGHDDFLRIGLSGTYFETDGEGKFPPRISVGYGRDFMFLKNADFLCRLEVRASYLLTDSYSDHDEDSVVRRTTHFIANLSFGVFFF